MRQKKSSSDLQTGLAQLQGELERVKAHYETGSKQWNQHLKHIQNQVKLIKEDADALSYALNDLAQTLKDLMSNQTKSTEAE